MGSFADGNRDCAPEDPDDDKTDAIKPMHQVISQMVRHGSRRSSVNASRRGSGSTVNPMSTMVKPPRLSDLA